MYIEISELPETLNVNDDSVFPLVFEGVTKKVTFLNLKKIMNYYTSVSYNKTTGQFVFTKVNGAEAILSTDLNSSVKDVSMLSNGQLEFTKQDNTKKIVDISIADGSITKEKLSSELQVKIDEIDILHSWLDQTTDTAEGEGKEITLENTLELPLKNITEEGNSEQESTEGKNLFNGILELGIINGETGANDSNNNYIRNKDYIPIKSSTSYIISTTNENIITEAVFVYFYDENQNYILPQSTSSYSSSIKGYRVNSYSNAKYMRFRPRYGTSDTTIKFQVEEGTTATNYEQYTGGIPAPNPSYSFPIKSVTGNNNVVVHTKNRFDINSIELASQQSSLVNMDITNNVVTFTAKATTGAQLGTAYVYNLNKTKNYRFSFKGKKTVLGTDGGVNIRIVVQGSNDNTNWTQVANLNQSSPVLNQEYSFAQTITGYTTYRIYLYNNTSTPVTIGEQTQYYDIMLIEGATTPSEYIPYANQTKPLNLGNIELNGIGDYRDLIFKAVNTNPFYDSLTSGQKALLNYGNWYKHEEIGKVTLNGSENWSALGSYQRYKLAINNYVAPQTSVIGDILCNRLKATTKNEIAFTDNAISGGETGSSDIFIRIDSTITTLQELITFLSTHNLIVYYNLATPTDIQITDTTLISQLEEIDKMQSYNGTTIITSTFDSNNAQMILSVSGYKNKVTDARLNDIEARLALLEE